MAVETMREPTEEMVDRGCFGMYGPGWDGPPEKQPGEKMKDVWRSYVRRAWPEAINAALSA